MDACAESEHHVSLWSAVGLATAITACSPSSPDKTNTPRTAPTPPTAPVAVEHFYGDGSGDPTGFTLTNAEGYYVLCGYWDDYGQSARVRKDGYRTSIESFGWSTEIDFEVVRE
jgi:hypothetical protein